MSQVQRRIFDKLDAMKIRYEEKFIVIREILF
ncbi:MAG: hypothetical protein H6Q70_4613 [Firmicutes bacterium]|nr:hypothetical protein [Bacillota bacterium]